ncbi:hypothetical protein [Halogeometricum borinquense]|uniref:hypothetical protein n=1 Tax=Halogeometricum borinquense TaxID=60847 RepID=UPI0034263971
MLDGPARDSFRYALNPELLKLYAAIVVGLSGISLSQHDLFDALAEPLGFLLSARSFFSDSCSPSAASLVSSTACCPIHDVLPSKDAGTDVWTDDAERSKQDVSVQRRS